MVGGNPRLGAKERSQVPVFPEVPMLTVPVSLNHLDRVGGHPDVDLLETGLEPFFELEEERDFSPIPTGSSAAASRFGLES
jgi:hypothetical protein